MQSPEQVAHDSAGAGHRFRVLHSGPKLIVGSLPVHATELGIPVSVTNGSPDMLEGVDVQLLLRGGELGGENSAEEERAQTARGGRHVDSSISAARRKSRRGGGTGPT